MRKLILGVLICSSAGGVTKALAQIQEYTIILRVQLTGTYSISFSTTTINFGIVQAGTKSVAAESVTVTYQGFANGKVGLRIAKSWATWTAMATFTTPTQRDHYVQLAMFNSVSPDPATYTSRHLVTTELTYADGSRFAGDQTGYNLSGLGESVNLWFMLWAPPAITPPLTREWPVTVVVTPM